MKSLLNKSYFYFWVTTVVIIVIRFATLLRIKESTLIINAYDTYFITAYKHITIVLFLYYAFIGLIYFIYHKLKIQLNAKLTIAHTVLSIGCFFGYYLGEFFMIRNFSVSLHLKQRESLNDFILVLILIVLFAQTLFLLNLILSTVKMLKQKSKK
jgi:hypothetical protein